MKTSFHLPFSTLLSVLLFTGTGAGQVLPVSPPGVSFTVGDASGTATPALTAEGRPLIELAGLRDGVIRLPLGVSRREVTRLLGNPYYTSILQQEGVIAFDDRGGLIRGWALGDEEEDEARPGAGGARPRHL